MTAPAAAAVRFVDTRSILNFRDYGGYPARDGARLRDGLLYRSADHSGASDEDLARVEALALRVVVDLRGQVERSSRPCRLPSNFTGRIVVSRSVQPAAAPHLAAIATPSTADMVRARLIRYYQESIFRPAQMEALRLYFEALADADGPSLVHCAAGKDRTGIACALLQASLGVSRDDIVADYMMTNLGGTLEERAAAFAYSVHAHLGEGVTDEALHATLTVEPDYIVAMLDRVADRCGTAETYLREALGLQSEVLTRIERAHLI